MPMPVFRKKIFSCIEPHTAVACSPQRSGAGCADGLVAGNHQQPEGNQQLKISTTLFTLENGNNNTLDGLILLLVIPGYKASAKNTNGTSFRYSCFF